MRVYERPARRAVPEYHQRWNDALASLRALAHVARRENREDDTSVNRRSFFAALMGAPVAIKVDPLSVRSLRPGFVQRGGIAYGVASLGEPMRITVGRGEFPEEIILARSVEFLKDGIRRVGLANGHTHSYSPTAYFRILPDRIGLPPYRFK
jgi:hypothetical protein